MVIKEKSVCKLCSKSFSRPDNLIRHSKSCLDNESKHICQYCGVSIKRYDNYTQHQSNCIKSNKSAPRTKFHKCLHCPKCYHRKQELQRHILLKHSDHNTLRCEMCFFTTSYKNILKRHLHNSHDKHKSLYRCSVCLIDFRTDYALTQHRKEKCASVTDSKTCKLCCIRFRTLNIFKEHLQAEHSDAVSVFSKRGQDLDDILHSFTVKDFISDCKKLSKVTATPSDISPTTLLNLEYINQIE